MDRVEEGRGARQVMWCLACGIPYAPEMRFCSHCGQSLAATTTDSAAETPEDAPAVPLAPVMPAAAREPAPAAPPAPPASATEPAAPPPAPAGQPHAGQPQTPVPDSSFVTRQSASGRAPRRGAPASEAEIEAAAAAIVARALAAQQAQGAPAAHAAGEPLPASQPEPHPDLALPYTSGPDSSPSPLQGKDRAWLMAGVVLCVLVVLVAVVFTRYVTAVAH